MADAATSKIKRHLTTANRRCNKVMQSVLSYVGSLLSRCWTFVFRNPLRTLYFTGPWLGGYGFWNSKPLIDICTFVNPRTKSEMWRSDPEYCQALVEEEFDAFVVGVQFVLAVSILLYLIKSVVNCMLMRAAIAPLRRDVQQLLMLEQSGHKNRKRILLLSDKPAQEHTE